MYAGGLKVPISNQYPAIVRPVRVDPDLPVQPASAVGAGAPLGTHCAQQYCCEYIAKNMSAKIPHATPNSSHQAQTGMTSSSCCCCCSMLSMGMPSITHVHALRYENFPYWSGLTCQYHLGLLGLTTGLFIEQINSLGQHLGHRSVHNPPP